MGRVWTWSCSLAPWIPERTKWATVSVSTIGGFSRSNPGWMASMDVRVVACTYVPRPTCLAARVRVRDMDGIVHT